MNRDSGTDSANGGWLRRLVRPYVSHLFCNIKRLVRDCTNSKCLIGDAANSKRAAAARWANRERLVTDRTDRKCLIGVTADGKCAAGVADCQSSSG